MIPYLIGGVAILALLTISLLVAFALRRVVPTNMVHIVQSGKRTIVYGKGRDAGNVYYQWPSFLPVVGVTVTSFPESVFIVSLDGYSAYDQGRLPFLVDVRAFFRIQDSDVAANRVASFAELTQQLQAVLQGAVRRVLAGHKLEETLGMRAELAITFTQEVDVQLKEWGVATAKTIEFMDMKDVPNSTVIHDIMSKEQARISQESRVAIANQNQTAEMAEVAARQVVSIREQESQQAIGERTAEQEREVGVAKEKSRQEVLTQAEQTKTREMAVRQVELVRSAEIGRSVAEVTADQERKVTVVNADAERQRLTTVADGQLAAAQKDAEAVRVRGEAEGAAKTAILQAEVSPQITLAKEIGENSAYQTYLVTIEQVKANRDVGIEQAKALTAAEIKVIATGGSADEGISSIGGLLSARGGQAISAMLAGLAQTPEGEAATTRRAA
jgi:flotillin